MPLLHEQQPLGLAARIDMFSNSTTMGVPTTSQKHVVDAGDPL